MSFQCVRSRWAQLSGLTSGPRSSLINKSPQRILLRPSHRELQTSVNQIKRGTVLDFRNKLWIVNNMTHHSQGRGGAHYKLDLREVLGGGKLLERFNAGTMVETVDLQVKQLKFMYADHELHLLDPVDYEEHVVPMSLFSAGDKGLPFLKDSMELKVEYYENTPVIIKMPERATYEVVNTAPPASSGASDSKGTAFKDAELETGARVLVPEFVTIGDKIVVDLLEHKYVTRAR
ncbi:uncharacterized protein EV422DRAFT_360963 [Fimicolochytrium jonesii]|uniref:uncharacterized protein n=1 Tax=Fimicolochytrium jonesii TaxID=1396493 RepID=UPI0022FE00B0|nr:uncharacterized protein EV422DRAFT_360963 [Fimicolochytrium jonesii]KAI8823577.1 hypothetical protein EV422DRAFT_360963 [Fimicolochytrium jonesii]